MFSLWAFLTIVHVVGLCLGVGSATVKVLLLVKSYRNVDFLPAWFKVVKPITGLLLAGFALATLSGIGWLLLGYGFTNLLILKLILVGIVWLIGPVIDNVFEPRFHQLAPAPGAEASVAFIRIQKQHFAIEVFATLLFYIILVIGILL